MCVRDVSLVNEGTDSMLKLIKYLMGSWRDGSGTKRTGRSSRGPKFGSQHPHSVSEVSVTSIPGGPMFFSSLLGHGTHIAHRQATTYTIKKNIKGLKGASDEQKFMSLTRKEMQKQIY